MKLSKNNTNCTIFYLVLVSSKKKILIIFFNFLKIKTAKLNKNERRYLS